MSVAACSHPVADCSYEVVLKNKDTKGQLMSLQQTLRQEIHAKIGAQSAEESAKRKVRCTTWAARSNTWLLIEMTPNGVIFSFLFYDATAVHRPHGQTLPLWQDLSALGTMHMISLCSTAHSCLVVRAANGQAPSAMDADPHASCSAVVYTLWRLPMVVAQKLGWLLCVGERVAGQHARAAGGTGPGDYCPQTGTKHSGRGVSPQKQPGSQV